MSPRSALLPLLDTLPGYPVAPDPGIWDILWVTLIVPGAISLVIAALGMGPTWLRKDADHDDPHSELQGVRARERQIEAH